MRAIDAPTSAARSICAKGPTVQVARRATRTGRRSSSAAVTPRRRPVGSSDHGVSLSLYAKDPDGLEFEVFWTVPGGRPVGTRALDLEGELARRGIPMPQEIDVAPSA